MFTHTTKIRVRYGETDQMGYMYYGNYAEFFEVGRVEMLRSLGMTYGSMEASGIIMPVLEMHCKYIRPAFYDEEITVKVIVEKKPGIRIDFKYELYNEREELIHLGETILCFINQATSKPCLPPVDFRNKLKAFFE